MKGHAKTTLDVEKIKPDPTNPRRKLDGIDTLAASIDAVGLLTPILVRPLAGGGKGEQYIVVSGHRRLAAMKSLKWQSIPVTIDANHGDAKAALRSIVAPVIDNTARVDLDAADLAEAIGRFDGLEMTDEEIAAVLDLTPGDVADAKTVHKAPAKVKAKALKGDVTLEQAAVLVEFSDNADDLKRISDTLQYNPGQFDHIVARIRDDRADRAEVARIVEAFKGAKRIEFRSYESPPTGSAPIQNLTDAEGTALTAREHETCKGRAFRIRGLGWDEGKIRAEAWCADWKKHGHKMKQGVRETHHDTPGRRTPAADQTPEQREKASKERREVIANNKAWTPATEVRLAWVKKYLERKTLPANVKDWIAHSLVESPGSIVDARQLANAGLLDRGDGKVPSNEKVWVVLLAQLWAHREEALSTAKWRPTDYNKRELARYLTLLESLGYALSDVEKIVTKGFKAS